MSSYGVKTKTIDIRHETFKWVLIHLEHSSVNISHISSPQTGTHDTYATVLPNNTNPQARPA